MLFKWEVLSYHFTRVMRWQLCLIFIFISSHTTGRVVYAAPNSIGEYEEKAVYLNNFSKFITWPSSIFSADSKNSPFYICILGDDPFKIKLDITVEDEVVEGHPIKIDRLQTLNETKRCHILYISRSEKRNLKNVVKHLQDYPVLTVSDIDDFTQVGGMIEYYMDNNRVRFKIHPIHIRQSGLLPSSSLLEIATIVNSTE